MYKDDLLTELANKVNSGEVTREEVLARLKMSNAAQTRAMDKEVTHFSMTKMLYVLGAAIVIIGIVIFVYQVWNDIGSLGRIAVTLGLGLLLTGIGSMLLKQRPAENIGSVFHVLGGVLIPGGAMVTLSELSTGVDHPWVIASTFAIIFVFYLLLNSVHKNAVLTFFTIANGTATIYLVLNAIVGGPYRGWFEVKDVYQYTTMAIGLSYLLLAYKFREDWNTQLVGVLNFFGTAGFLGAAFSQVFDSQPWQMVYFLLVIGGLFLSAFLKSRAVLVVSTLFLLAHVSFITSKYFADSVGWPISLVVLGFIFIGLGYVSININRKYIAQ